MREWPGPRRDGRIPEKGAGVGTVNQGAVNQQQQNQQQGQQYAAQQQQAALTDINNWTAANKPPGQTAAPLQAPQAASPATMGGGMIQAGKPQPRMMPQGQPPGIPPNGAAGAPPAATPNPLANLSPQQRQQLVTALQAQTAPGMGR